MAFVLKDVWNGWKNVLFDDSEMEKVAQRRFENHCKNCETRSKRNFCSKSKGGCGCPLIALLRSKEAKCKLGKW